MSTVNLTPMTEVEAVNDMLSAIGESPVASLEEANGVADAEIALLLLRRVSRAVQQVGWGWNTEDDYTLNPNEMGEIILPQNTLKVDPTDQCLDYISRDGKLWDRKNHTFNIGAPVSVEIVLDYAFEELPEVAREYIAQLALRKFENRMQGDPTQDGINASDLMVAWSNLIEQEAEIEDFNVIKDSTTVRRISKNYR